MKDQLRLCVTCLLGITLALLVTPPSTASESPPAAAPGVPADWWAQAQAEIEQVEYSITWQDQTYLPGSSEAFQAPNRAENLRTYFEPGGPTVLPRLWAEDLSDPPWRWELRLAAWGREGMEPVPAASLEVQGNLIEYRRGPLVEWYRNDGDGLAQGFRLSVAPPAGGSPAPLALELLVDSDLTRQGGEGPGAAFLDAEGQTVLRYGALSAADADGRSLPVWLSTAGHALLLLVDDAGASYPIEITGSITGLPSTDDWSLTWGTAGTQFGCSAGTAGDVNGDGRSDVVVGARYFDGGQTDEGAAFIFLGHPLGLGTAPAWSKESDQAHAQFGYSVATAGDVNGDGYADVIVGAPKYDHPDSDEGGAWVYHGSTTGVHSVPDFFAQSDQAGAELGSAVASAGDVNGDGYADVIVGAWRYDAPTSSEGAAFVWYGSAHGVNGSANGVPANAAWRAEADQEGAFLGIAVSTAGDVNGDGYADVIVGANEYGGGDEGLALVWHSTANGPNNGVVGTPGNAEWTAAGASSGAHLGRSVSTAGDVNGDGYADVIVGSPHYTNGQAGEGTAYLYLGSDGGLAADPDNQDEGNMVEAWFGQSVAMAGDVNGDGYADVVVGAPLYTNDQTEEGRAFLWYGSPSGISATRDWWAEGNATQAWYGNSVATAGDVNGDGYSDLIVGAPGEASQAGSAFVYHGSPDMPREVANWSKRSNMENAYFGWSVGTAGDVNADGYADIIVGAPLWDAGQVNEGAAWIYRGSAAGLVSTPYWYEQSDRENAQFGYSVGTAGDVNGDGYGDVIVGTPYYAHDAAEEGGAWVYHGSSSGVSTTSSWHKESDQAGARFGYSVATAGDVNNDGYADVVIGAPLTDHGQVDEGVAWIYHGSPGGLHLVPARHMESDHAGAQFGYSVATAGDVNADGFSDVVVGAPYWEDDAMNEGRAWLYLGSDTGLSSSAPWHAESNTSGARLGHAVASAGDVNGDGYSDVVVGAPYWADGTATGEGRVWVFHGSASGLSATHAWTRESGQNDAYYGFAVGTAGDVNGDGYAALLIGAPSMTPAGGASSAGLVRLYLGSGAGLGSTYAWTGQGGGALSWFGISAGTAGDVNGDGYADLVIGAKDDDSVLENEGKVVCYYGNGRSGAALALRQLNSAGQVLASLGHTDEDTFRLAFVHTSPFGRGKIMAEIEVKPLGINFDGHGTYIPGGLWMNHTLPGATSMIAGDLHFDQAYHWRMRTLYHPGTTPWMPASRWVTVPWNGWNEEDLGTSGSNLFLPLVTRDVTTGR